MRNGAIARDTTWGKWRVGQPEQKVKREKKGGLERKKVEETCCSGDSGIRLPLQTIIESTRGGKREAVNQLPRMKCLYRSVTSCWTEGMCHML